MPSKGCEFPEPFPTAPTRTRHYPKFGESIAAVGFRIWIVWGPDGFSAISERSWRNRWQSDDFSGDPVLNHNRIERLLIPCANSDNPPRIRYYPRLGESLAANSFRKGVVLCGDGCPAISTRSWGDLGQSDVVHGGPVLDTNRI